MKKSKKETAPIVGKRREGKKTGAAVVKSFNQTAPRALAFLLGFYSLFSVVIIYSGISWLVSPQKEGIAVGFMILLFGIGFAVAFFYWAYKIYDACERRSKIDIRRYSLITLTINIITLAYIVVFSDPNDPLTMMRLISVLFLALLAIASYSTNRTDEDDYWNKRKLR